MNIFCSSDEVYVFKLCATFLSIDEILCVDELL